MSIASIQESLLSSTIQKNDLTSQLTTIMGRLTLASRQNLELMESTTANKQYLKELASEDEDYATSDEYQTDMEAVDDDYELQLAEINNWEAELNQEKNTIETNLKEVETTQEGYTSMLKGNLKREFTYGQSSS